MIRKSSSLRPLDVSAANHFGCLPRPAQVSLALAGLRYFGATLPSTRPLVDLRAVFAVAAVGADATGLAPFEEFQRLLAELYPLAHTRLETERIGELGLVYRWRPAEPNEAAPVVLMAHYDVVPVAGQE